VPEGRDHAFNRIGSSLGPDDAPGNGRFVREEVPADLDVLVRKHLVAVKPIDGPDLGSGEASAVGCLFAGPIVQFGDLRRQSVAEVGSLEHRADLDLAWAEHWIGAALHPLDSLGDVLDLP
jgi:hypothetical protein